MNLEDHNLFYDYLIKIVLVGDSGVGKSCFLLRYADDTYSDSYISTIGVDFKIKTIQVDNKIVKQQIWDTAGQERFRTITSSYYRGAHAIGLFFDLTNTNSFKNLERWISDIKHYVHSDIPIVVIGTKSDLLDKRAINMDDINHLCATYNFNYIETSSKSNLNVDYVFTDICKKAMENIRSSPPKQNNLNISNSTKPLLSGKSIKINQSKYKCWE